LSAHSGGATIDGAAAPTARGSEGAMAKYLFKVRYSSEGLEGVMDAGGSARRSAADDLAKNLGGSLECFYFAFGDDDAYVIADLPDNKAAATLAMTVTASGRVSLSTVPLLTVDELDAISSGRRPEYTPPGR
jgi:uncharacterized protein with GYD domain